MIDELTSAMLDKPSVKQGRCCVCGAPATNNHHVIQKGMGGTKLEGRIPTLTLCGMGNTCGCHGLAHSGRLHFRWSGEWECLVTKEPTKYGTALAMDGWFQLPFRGEPMPFGGAE